MSSSETPGTPPPAHKRRNRWFLLAGVVLVTLILGGFGYLQLQRRLTQPLGPALNLPTKEPTAVPVALILPTATHPVDLPITPSASLVTEIPASPTSLPTATPKPLCGGPAVMYLLGIGADADIQYRYGLADAIRIARVDFVTPKITVLSMPRDLWVKIPDIATHYGITEGKLNQAYFYGSPGMGYYQGPGGAPGLLARALDLNFGLTVEHYGAVNMETFKKIVDAVGGIDIYLPNDVDGRPIDAKTEDMGYFTAGQKHFNGDQALRFSRIRKKYNDFTRMDNQTMVLCALRKKITSAAVLPKIPQIINSFVGSVQTDLSLEQIGQLACLLPSLKRENILFTGLPPEIFSPAREYSDALKNETFVLDVDNKVVRDYIDQFIAGTWPTVPDEPTCP